MSFQAENFKGDNNPVMAIRGAKVSEWGGRTLSVVQTSQMMLNPDIPACHRLRGWYDNGGNQDEFMEYRSEGGSMGGGEKQFYTNL